MKKFSTFLILIISLFTVLFTGCTYADNATLLSIREKYQFIANKNAEFYDSDKFLPSYDSDKLLNVIYSNNTNYSVLKTDNLENVYTNRGEFGVLMQAVNSTYYSMSNAFMIVSNNGITDKKYKKQMYSSLEQLQKDIKTLDQTKRSLESTFNNNSGDSLTIAEEQLSLYNLDKYKKALTCCLLDLLDFNINFNRAINNNISAPLSLNDLFYSVNTEIVVTSTNNSTLVNNFNMIASNFVLNYSINLKNDMKGAKQLIDIMAILLNEQAILSSNDITEEQKVNDYKMIRALEDSIMKKEITFNNAIKTLKVNSFDNPDVSQTIAINSINEMKAELLAYGNKLIEYLQKI